MYVINDRLRIVSILIKLGRIPSIVKVISFISMMFYLDCALYLTIPLLLIISKYFMLYVTDHIAFE